MLKYWFAEIYVSDYSEATTIAFGLYDSRELAFKAIQRYYNQSNMGEEALLEYAERKWESFVIFDVELNKDMAN